MEMHLALAARKKELGISYEDLALRSGVPVDTLKKIFTGRVKAPGFESIRDITYAMDMSLSDLDERIAEDSAVSAEEMDFLRKFRRIDQHGQRLVRFVLDSEHERVQRVGKVPD